MFQCLFGGDTGNIDGSYRQALFRKPGAVTTVTVSQAQGGSGHEVGPRHDFADIFVRRSPEQLHMRCRIPLVPIGHSVRRLAACQAEQGGAVLLTSVNASRVSSSKPCRVRVAS